MKWCSFFILRIKKITNAISIEKIRIEEKPNKLKKTKIIDDSPNPIGKERLTRKGTLSVFARAKIRWQDKNPRKSDSNMEKNIII